jgi:hypothetical protein
LYGFDADADSGVTPSIDGALTTELAEPLTAENGDILQFEPASGAVPPSSFETATLSDSNSQTSGTNTITFTVQPGIDISAGGSITLAGLTSSQTVDGSLTLSGAGASVFGSAGSWTQSTGTLVLTVATGQTLSTGSDTVITFNLQNSATLGSGVTATLDANDHNQANVSGTVLDTIHDSTLTFPTAQVFDNESDFISDSGADDYTIVHAKDTDKLYVWDGDRWFLYNNDSTV